MRPDFSLYFGDREGVMGKKRKPRKPPAKTVEVVVTIKPPKRPAPAKPADGAGRRWPQDFIVTKGTTT
jgi:hypothetical protein